MAGAALFAPRASICIVVVAPFLPALGPRKKNQERIMNVARAAQKADKNH
jgi:hypothetical protein